MPDHLSFALTLPSAFFASSPSKARFNRSDVHACSPEAPILRRCLDELTRPRSAADVVRPRLMPALRRPTRDRPAVAPISGLICGIQSRWRRLKPCPARHRAPSRRQLVRSAEGGCVWR